MQDSNIRVNFRHVNSHQDDVKAFEELDEWETANYWADRLAKDALREYMEEGCPTIETRIQEAINGSSC